ncbi:MAG: triple tyrosine motif-containing protein [Saprospiraceae bacterium]
MRFLFCLLLAPSLLFSQKKEYEVHYFGYREGIADRGVLSICHEQNGAVWLGTERGLFRWDGYEMLDFSAKFPLPPDVNLFVWVVVEDSRRWLWVAANQGLFRLPPDRSRCERILDNTVFGLVADEEQHLLALCQTSQERKTLFRIRPSDAPPVLDTVQVPGGFPRLLFPAPAGGLFVQNEKYEMLVLRRGRCEGEPFGGLDIGPHFFQHFLRMGGSSPTYLVIAGVQSVRWFEGGRFHACQRGALPADTAAWCEPFALFHQYFRFAVQNAGIFPKEHLALIGLPNSVEPDRYGNLWCGTRVGVFVLSPRQPGLRHLAHTLGKSTRAIFTDADGLWVSTVENKLFFQKTLNSPPRRFSPAPVVRTFLPVGPSRFLVGGDYAEFYFFNKKTGFEPKINPNIQDETYAGLSDGRHLWHARRGLMRFDLDGRNPRFFPLPMLGHQTKSMQRYRDGSLLLPSSAGLFRVPISSDGTPQSPETLVEKVDFPGSLLVGDTLWLGTAGRGLWCFDLRTRQIAARFTPADGLPDGFINCILHDPPSGQLWISTNRGLSRFDPRTRQFLNFGPSDGLQNVEFNTSSAWREPATGRMFFGGLNGVTHFLPAEIQKTYNLPEAFLSKIMRPGRMVGQFETMHPDRDSLEAMLLEIAPTERFVEFYLASSDMVAPEQNRFFYKLEGFDPDWVAAGTHPVVRFTRLEAGDYVFRFKTVNHDGRQSAERRLRLRVEPIFYKTWWFAALALAAVAGLLVGYFRLKIRQVKQMHRERKRIADDLHDDVAATVSQLSVLAKSLASRPIADTGLPAALQKIGSLSDESLGKLADIVWAVDDRRQTLGDLANRLQDHAEMLFQPLRIRLRTEIELAQPERNLKSAVRHHVMLIFKEALHNIVRHTESQVVFLKMENRGRSLSVVIENEFRGLRQVASSSGKGLESMAGRVRQLGGRFHAGKAETTFRVIFSLPDVFE